ncbi:unnamed protein product [Cuscuta campestris]|uniref:Reverse transcriptase zinc-binding domain-containing protein n=1 Tax=Cuscuta campestris TaxID=132261 RepID=A0A484K1N1_9ASTE|nr:unnamed protein product [Cuscuta campestris]
MQDVEEFLIKGGFKEFKLRRLKSQEILFIFKREEDYLRWFHQRKWNIKSSTITLCKWSVDYSPFKDCPVIPVWVEIKNIPLHLSDQIPLYSIASALGKPLKLGRKTAMGIYPGSAKVCVEMDVSISKPPKIHLRLGTRDLWLPCSYEDHPPFCSKCLRFGHQLSHCRKLSSQAELLGPSGAGGSKQEWKMVMRKVPKPSHDLRRKAPTPGKHLQNPVLFNPPQIPQSKSSSGTEQPTTSLDVCSQPLPSVADTPASDSPLQEPSSFSSPKNYPFTSTKTLGPHSPPFTFPPDLSFLYPSVQNQCMEIIPFKPTQCQPPLSGSKDDLHISPISWEPEDEEDEIISPVGYHSDGGLNILLAMPQGAKLERMYLPTFLHEASVLECLWEELSSQTETEYEANPTQENRERMQKANAELIIATKLEIITVEDNTFFCATPSMEEVQKAVWDLDGNSAGGPDGFNGNFFKSAWETIKQDVLIASQDFFMGQHIPKAYGSTFLTLIPKTENPKRFEDYRPISLSTFMSKINTKILANRLNTLLPKLISKEQAAFQKGKSIDDHILMAQEAVHLLDKKVGDNRNLLKLKVTLDIYLKATGQEINLNKSRFYTSKHTTSSQNQHMEKALGIKRGNLPFTYLGAPICKGIMRKEHCKDILGHFEKLIHSWYSKTLNQMGRLILIKHFLSSIPLHTLAIHTIPKSIIHTLNRYMTNFLWGQKEGSHKHHWVRWAQITKPEVEGGLGIKSLKDLQQAYTLKLWWKARIDIGIWGPYVRARYMKTGIMKERITDSPTWKRICRSNDLATSHTTTTSSGLLWEGGNFSLKSAFNMVQGSGTNILSCKYIWHSSNIPKIKIFLWRLLNSALPFPKNLCRFMAALPSFCPLCHKDNDDIDDSMLHCPTAKEV